jgi:hypothetical protein
MTLGEQLDEPPEPELPKYEHVYVETEWYDGPWAGVADLDGVPHYFAAVPEGLNLPDRRFHVWPISPETFALERESWQIYVRWNDRYAAGEVGHDTHPGTGGLDARYDELQQLLEPFRQAPLGALVLMMHDLRLDNEDPRYRLDGTDYEVSWRTGADLGH